MTESDFLAAIIANPDDDAPRLIFADWLDEQGQGDRAEFIRVQCALARIPDALYRCSVCGHPDDDEGEPHPADCRYWQLIERERQLLYPEPGKTAAWRFVGPTLRRTGQFGGCTFRRGFVAEAHLLPDFWLSHHAALLAEEPIRTVHLTTMPGLPALELRWPNESPFWEFSSAWTNGMPQLCPEERATEEAYALLRSRWPGVEFCLPMPRALREAGRLAAFEHNWPFLIPRI